MNVRVIAGRGSSKLAERMRQSRQVLSLSDAAARRLRTLLQERSEPTVGFRLGLRTKGCNGLAYTLDFATQKEQFDEEVNDKGVRLLVAPNALLSVIGTEMDYVQDKLRSEFVFMNPNATSTCGCGESFTVDLDTHLAQTGTLQRDVER